MGGTRDTDFFWDVEGPCPVGDLDSLQEQVGAFWAGKQEKLVQDLEIPFVMEWKQ